MTKITNLQNVKIDLRDPVTGKVDNQRSIVFQLACFEQGITWQGSTVTTLNEGFLVTNEHNIQYTKQEGLYQNLDKPEIDLKYELTWEAAIVEKQPERKVIHICGVDYYEDKVDEILKLFGGAKVETYPVGSVGEITPMTGTGTPPERPPQEQEEK